MPSYSLKRTLRMVALSTFMLNAFTLPVFAAGLDEDSDGLFDEDEAALGYDSTNQDTDGDGTLDGYEDFDGDTLNNVNELYVYFTDATLVDTDGDLREDGNELAELTNPLLVELPDLEIETFELDPVDNTIAITIFNAGNYPVDSGVSPELRLYTADDGILVDTIELDTYGTDYKNVGTRSTLFNSTYALDGSVASVNILAVLDAADEVYGKTEHPDFYVEGANTLRTTFLFGEELYPDLVVDSITFNEADSSVSFVVRNAGTAAVPVDALTELRFTLDYNSDMSTAGSFIYLINDYGTDYQTLGGSTTVNTGPGPEDGVFPSCTMYVVVVVDENGSVVESDETNNEFSTSLQLCPGFSVEAGNDEGIGQGNVYNLAAYTLDAESLDSATVDWGDGSAVEMLTQSSLVGEQIDLTAPHLYDHQETFLITVCADDGSGTLCDTLQLSITGNSGSGPTMPSNTVSVSTNTSSTTGTGISGSATSSESTDSSSDGSSDETDQDVTLTGDEEIAADCSAMLFEDVNEDDDFYDAVCELWGADVIHGRTATSFDSEDSIRRDEASKMFTRLFGYVTEAYGDTPAAEGTFNDVEATDPLAYYVEVANENDLVTGDTNSTEVDGEVVTVATFNPHDDITAQEIADALKEILGDNTGGEQLDADGYDSGDSMTRGSFVELLYGLSR